MFVIALLIYSQLQPTGI